jgi:hypothetical protein
MNLAASSRPIRFASGLGAIFLAGALHPGPGGAPVHRERNFFGVLQVTNDRGGRFRQIVHGRVVHGRQSLDPARSREPLSYFHPTGPVADVFALFEDRAPPARVAVIGLGAGTMACYARPAQAWTFYEINPAVVRIATDPALFTYLRDCLPDPSALRIELGDARLMLELAPPAAFDLIALDAFSSDAIPVHLLTREAFALYFEKLAEDGVLAAHISNLYLDLAPVLAALADDAGRVAYVREDADVPEALSDRGKSSSTWVAMARSPTPLVDLILRNTGWTPLDRPRGARVWTDAYSDVLSAIRR